MRTASRQLLLPLRVILLFILVNMMASVARAAVQDGVGEASTGESACVASTHFEGPERFALIVAVSDYDLNNVITRPELSQPGYLQDLPNSVNDGRAIRTALCHLGFHVTLVENPTKSQMEISLARFGAIINSNPNSVNLFYYAGHAVQVDGVNWLIPNGATLPSEDLTRYPSNVQAGFIGSQAVALTSVFQYFRQSNLGGGGVNLIFIDGCRSDPWEDRLFPGTRGSPNRGLAEQSPSSRGTLVFYSTAAGSVAGDGDRNGNSPFATALLESIAEPGLSVSDLLIRVTRRVVELTRDRQAPFQAGSLAETFCFAGCARSEPRPPVQAAVPPVRSEPYQIDNAARCISSRIGDAGMSRLYSEMQSAGSRLDRDDLGSASDYQRNVIVWIDRLRPDAVWCAARLGWTASQQEAALSYAVNSAFRLASARALSNGNTAIERQLIQWFANLPREVRTTGILRSGDVEGLAHALGKNVEDEADPSLALYMAMFLGTSVLLERMSLGLAPLS